MKQSILNKCEQINLDMLNCIIRNTSDFDAKLDTILAALESNPNYKCKITIEVDA